MVRTMDLKIQSQVNILFILTQNASSHFRTIYCDIIAICLPHIAIYRDTLMAYRDSPSILGLNEIYVWFLLQTNKI